MGGDEGWAEGGGRRAEGGGGAGAGVGMSGEGIFACEANAKIVTARRGRAGGAGSGKCKRETWIYEGLARVWTGAGKRFLRSEYDIQIS